MRYSMVYTMFLAATCVAAAPILSGPVSSVLAFTNGMFMLLGGRDMKTVDEVDLIPRSVGNKHLDVVRRLAYWTINENNAEGEVSPEACSDEEKEEEEEEEEEEEDSPQ